ncbi:guanine deaminase [Exidia glandulosa HHB12029]|uniref:Guanine deaminase n=1 Tax=Exidia glandulosa HHB12029 TaxID=1314781 RepID=A0A165R0Z7_EXIGL|nr:guanine deaminase [Exidia glandulosa HHB12029]
MASSLPTIFYGPILHTLNHHTLQILPRALLAVAGGRIAWLIENVLPSDSGDTIRSAAASKGWHVARLHALKDGEFIIPGFIDTHTHAPQFPNLGRGQDYELLGWLHHITFPTESRFKDLEYARRTYESVVRRTLDCGTTTCCYYATLHEEATNILADVVHKLGQRAFVGKCNMDRESPDHYCEPSAQVSIEATQGTIQHIRGLKPAIPGMNLVHPILTPRFAISCTPELLGSLGELARVDRTLAIQTHISENPSEVDFVRTLFPDCRTYAHVYDAYGLLRENTVLAHGCHLDSDLLDAGADEEAISESEIELILSRGAGLSHCPTSNLNLRSGVARVGEWLDRGLKVSLGTDVSGGYSPSMLDAVRHASFCSKLVAMEHARKENSTLPVANGKPAPLGNRQLPLETLLFLATLGGAEVCNLASEVGNLVPGKSFDALVVSLRPETRNPNVWVEGDELQRSEESLQILLEKFLLCGDDRNIRAVYVAGRLAGGADASI